MFRLSSIAATVAIAATLSTVAAPALANDYRRHHHDDRGDMVAAGVLGLIGGALVAGALMPPSPPPVYYEPPPPPDYYYRPAPPRVVYTYRPAPPPMVYDPQVVSQHQAWCAGRYRSYNAYDNTWLDNYGRLRPCQSPYYSG